ncbi:hypothetical protein [Virgibacillus necropolis]|uniref:DUF4145 domain-containing protein n=1 Tax=Virgibacillus necropolis TaxID=163877 RepID=A0A221M9W0_9BACI|nr:hypothetical protein [Virgibacillus necropolis]ASN04402.1 hypothetical protein CFK40_04955 [Virgibacillus necropolis]
MNTLEFISSIIKSIAWPSVIIVIIITLRKPLQKLLYNINKVTYSNVAIEFTEELEAAKQNLEKAKPVFTLNNNQDKSFNKRENEIIEVAKISPSASITMSWLMVEEAINQTINHEFQDGEIEAPLQSIQFLKEQGIISSEIEVILNKLRRLRNSAVHGNLNEKLPYSAAIEYFGLAKNMKDILGSDPEK